MGNVGSSTRCVSRENSPRNGAELQGGGCEQPHVENGAIMQLIMANPFCHEFLITLSEGD